jgi:hypothetical protein
MLYDRQQSSSTLQQALVIGVCLLLVLSLLAVGLVVVAVQQRVVSLPAFSVRVGSVQFGGPCPSPAFNCDVNPNYYAVWVGNDQPDGSVRFHEVFFTYLPKRRW